MAAAKKKDEKKQSPIIVKKVKGKGGGHHGGAWKVAYADFVTAMMALFMVMWLVSSMDSETKAGVAQYFRNPGIFETTSGSPVEGQGNSVALLDDTAGSGQEEGSADFDKLQEKIESELKALEGYAAIEGQIRISHTAEGLMVEIMDKDTDAFFALGSAKLKPILRSILAKITEQIIALPNKVAVGGHTDARPFHRSAFYSNWELSAARALTARRAMEEMNLPSSRVERVVGYADSAPLLPDDPLNPANRRISILILREDAPRPTRIMASSVETKKPKFPEPPPLTEGSLSSSPD